MLAKKKAKKASSKPWILTNPWERIDRGNSIESYCCGICFSWFLNMSVLYGSESSARPQEQVCPRKVPGGSTAGPVWSKASMGVCWTWRERSRFLESRKKEEDGSLHIRIRQALTVSIRLLSEGGKLKYCYGCTHGWKALPPHSCC